MQKKLLVVAVLATLSGVASAQVTISGLAKASWERATRENTNPVYRIQDESSRLLFNVSEDLGGGLKGVGQFDLRLALDTGSGIPGSSPPTSGMHLGNSFVGAHSDSLGRVTFGRSDLHYGTAGTYFGVGPAAPLGALVGPGLMSQVAGVTVAVGSRSANVIRYQSPVMSGFSFGAAWSSDYKNASSESTGGTTTSSPTTTSVTTPLEPTYNDSGVLTGGSVPEIKDSVVRTVTTNYGSTVPTKTVTVTTVAPTYNGTVVATPGSVTTATTIGTTTTLVPAAGAKAIAPSSSTTTHTPGTGENKAGGMAYTFSAAYNNGPIGVAASYWAAKTEDKNQANMPASALGAPTAVYDETGMSIGAGYDIGGGLKIGAGFDMSSVTPVGTGDHGKKYERIAFGGGVNYTIPGTSVRAVANLGIAQPYKKGGTEVKSTGAMIMVFGAEYAFSPRTAIGAYYAGLKNNAVDNAVPNSGGNYGLFAGRTPGGAKAAPDPNLGDASSTMTVTVSHSF